MHIEEATFDHIDLIIEIGKQSFIESHGNSASLEDVNDFIAKTYSKEALLKEFKDENVKYHILFYKGEVAGFSKIEWNTVHENINSPHLAKLDRIYLLKKYYDKKLGFQLLDFVIELSKKNHQNGVWLAVWVENQRAIRFYSKTGFKIVGEYDFKISETHSNPNHIMHLKF